MAEWLKARASKSCIRETLTNRHYQQASSVAFTSRYVLPLEINHTIVWSLGKSGSSESLLFYSDCWGRSTMAMTNKYVSLGTSDLQKGHISLLG